MKKLYCVTTSANHGDCDNALESLESALEYIANYYTVADVKEDDVEIAVIEFDDDGNDECVRVYSAGEIAEMI